MLLAVFMFLKSRHASREYYTGPGQDYMAWSNWRFREAFRFEKEDFVLLVQLLEIPAFFSESGHVFVGRTCFLVTLNRFAYPCRWCSLESIFGEDRSRLSRMHKLCVNFLYDRWGSKVYMDLAFLLPRLQSYRRAIFLKTDGVVANMWGFIDGTAREICRPSFFQRLFFSGHKRYHCLKYQGIMCPDGIIAQMKGPWIGSRNDCGMLNESQLIDILSAHFNAGDIPIVLYGDPIYSFTSHIWSGFKGARLTEGEEQFNKTLSSVRESVEWGFGKVITYFAWLDFAKNQKNVSSAGGKVLRNWSLSNQLPHLLVWVPNISIL